MSRKFGDEAELLGALATRFYKTVPQDYLTYCSLTASVAVQVLRHFGHDAALLPCQAWYASASRPVAGPQRQNYLVGFVGQPPRPGKWDGHVVCATRVHIMDAALHHFEREFGVAAPQVAVVARIAIPTQVIARLDQDDGSVIGWLNPPPGVDATVPIAPPEVVADLAKRLIAGLEAE